MYDFIDFLVLVLPIVIALLSVYVSIKLTRNESHKLGWGIIIVLGIITSGLTWISQSHSRTEHKQEISTLQGKLDKSLLDEEYMKGKLNMIGETTKDLWQRTLPELDGLETTLNGLGNKIEIARKSGDPKLVARLEHKAREVREQKEELSQELLSMTMAPQIAERLRGWEREFQFEQDSNHNGEYLETHEYSDMHPGDRQGLSNVYEHWQKVYTDTERKYQDKLKDIVTSADVVRRELLKHVQQQPIDKIREGAFAQALRSPDALDRGEAASYLEDLVRRVSPPK